MSSSSSSMMRPGTGPFASGRMTPEPGLPHIKAATATPGSAAPPAAAATTLSPRAAVAGPVAGLPTTAAAPAAAAGRVLSGSTATDSLPIRHESESSRRSMHAQEENTASWDTACAAGKLSARHTRPMRSARGATALTLTITPRTARNASGSGPSSARLTALPLPPHTTLSTVQEPASRDPPDLSRATSSNGRSSRQQATPVRTRVTPSPMLSDDAAESSDGSVYRSSSSHSSNHMYDVPVPAARRGPHRASSHVSTPVMYELETVLGATATHRSQQGSFLQPLGGPPANLSAAGSAADPDRPRRSSVSTQRSGKRSPAGDAKRGGSRSERRAGAAVALRSFAPPATAAHAASDHGSTGSAPRRSHSAQRTAAPVSTGPPRSAPAADASSGDEGEAASHAQTAARSFSRRPTAVRAASDSAVTAAAAGDGGGARREGRHRHVLMSSALGLNTRGSIYCMGPEATIPSHRSQVSPPARRHHHAAPLSRPSVHIAPCTFTPTTMYSPRSTHKCTLQCTVPIATLARSPTPLCNPCMACTVPRCVQLTPTDSLPMPADAIRQGHVSIRETPSLLKLHPYNPARACSCPRSSRQDMLTRLL